MTKRVEYGEMNNIKQFQKEMAELKPGEGVRIDKDTKYEYGADLHTEGFQLIDPQEGKTNTIRTFEFVMNPAKVREFPTDKQAIFNAHAKQITTILWADGLRPLESVSPRVIIDLKGKKYQIFVPCEAAKGVLFNNKPQSLNEVLSKTSQNGTPRHKD